MFYTILCDLSQRFLQGIATKVLSCWGKVNCSTALPALKSSVYGLYRPRNYVAATRNNRGVHIWPLFWGYITVKGHSNLIC